MPVILLALVAAGLAAIAVFCVAAFVAGRGGAADFEFAVAMFLEASARAPGMLKWLVLAGCLAVVPLLGGILLIEALRLRAWPWYGAAAMAAALAANLIYAMLVMRYVPPFILMPELFRPGTPLIVLSVLSLLAASWVYWRIAGRNAGAWRRTAALAA